MTPPVAHNLQLSFGTQVGTFFGAGTESTNNDNNYGGGYGGGYYGGYGGVQYDDVEDITFTIIDKSPSLPEAPPFP